MINSFFDTSNRVSFHRPIDSLFALKQKKKKKKKKKREEGSSSTTARRVEMEKSSFRLNDERGEEEDTSNFQR
jgi:hypothetical protein